MWDSPTCSLPPSFNTHTLTPTHTHTHTLTPTHTYTHTHTHTHTNTHISTHKHTHTPLFIAPYKKVVHISNFKRKNQVVVMGTISILLSTPHEKPTFQTKLCFSSSNFPRKYTFIGHGTLK
ncbi:hypothetical protein EYF80_030949 [Liparis tanakae]|uniref:Uncharacterized protein n=1 Tax=Liparis tanakae TaxID=230148 RepID=A0A4Z2GZX8_9TELE|nr:hypothetical protein EYF80_030949 [Liparis tanakae]